MAPEFDSRDCHIKNEVSIDWRKTIAMIKKILHSFNQPSKRGALTLLMAGAVVGVALWTLFDVVIHQTNTMDFCTSCHSMAPVYEEYKKSAHYVNTSGVRATCSDCHVPEAFGPKILAKIIATNDLWHALKGTIDTSEKFEDRRLELAERVWQRMEGTDSRECRNCHSYDAMVIGNQSEEAGKTHPTAIKDSETCIACHKGIAHSLPDMSAGYRKQFEDLMAASLTAGKTISAGKYYTLQTMNLANSDSGDEQAATVLPATELEVIARNGEMLRVRLSGWQQEGAEGVVYAFPGRRILSAALTDQGLAALHKGASHTDVDTEQVWSEVSLEGWVKPTGLVADQNELWSYAGGMYSANCSICHRAQPPDHLLANQWTGNLDAMKRFITLDKEEYRFLLKYLQLHAQDIDKPGYAEVSAHTTSTPGK